MTVNGSGEGWKQWRAELPKRIPSRIPGVRMVSWGSMPQQVASARMWCWNGSKLDHHRAYPLLAVLSELHTNALRHTASGSPCGRVRMEMEGYRGVFWLAVTDDGALPGRAPTIPEVGTGFGLRLVDRLAAAWGWFGRPGHPITVWAVVDPRGSASPAVPGRRPWVPARSPEVPAPGPGAPEVEMPEVAVPAQRAAG